METSVYGSMKKKHMKKKQWFDIYRMRTHYVYGVPVCDICGLPIYDKPAMHHTIVMKRHVQGWKKNLRGLIDVPMNICVLHNYPCHLGPAHGAGGRLLIAAQIVRYGWNNIDEWVEGLPFKVAFLEWHRGIVDDYEASEIVREELPWIL